MKSADIFGAECGVIVVVVHRVLRLTVHYRNGLFLAELRRRKRVKRKRNKYKEARGNFEKPWSGSSRLARSSSRREKK